jgi:hypothetical protein
MILFASGLLVATAGAPHIGVPLLLVGVLSWVIAVAASLAPPIRARAGKRWFGPDSVMTDANERLGWGLLGEAGPALGLSSDPIRRALRAGVAVTIGLSVLAMVIGLAR